MSKLAYQESSLVTSLFEQARQLQIELGCPPEKIAVTPNGIRVENLQNISGKLPEDEDKINIGAVLRVTPIKDVKTMIQAFGFAKAKEPRLKLWIMRGLPQAGQRGLFRKADRDHPGEQHQERHRRADGGALLRRALL